MISSASLRRTHQSPEPEGGAYGNRASVGLVNAELITSPSNSHLKRARKLRQRKYRDKEGAFFVEGIQPVTQAIVHNAAVDVLLAAPDVLGEHPVSVLVEEERDRGVEVAWLSREAFESISARDDPSGLAAIVRAAPRAIHELAVHPGSVFVALDEVGNPGNLGAIIRTLDAVGGDGLVLMGSATDPYHPTAVKASMGTIFARPVCRVSGFPDLRSWAESHDLTVVTTSAKADLDHWDAPLQLPAVLVLGSEGRGLPAEVLDAGDVAVRIPIEGSASSLNLAIAASVLLYEIQRRRRKGAPS